MSAQQPLVSIIVPVYNVVSCMCRCVDSLLSQSYDNIEILLVDDGSTDGSEVLCDEYSRQHPERVRVHHQPNAGLSAARNCGLRLANGEYICYIDSDDYVNCAFVEKLLDAALRHGTDLAVCAVWRVDLDKNSGEVLHKRKWETGWEKEPGTPAVISGEKAMEFFAKNEFPPNAWNKLYHRRLAEQILFPEGQLCEDAAVIIDVFRLCHGLCYVPEAEYYYWDTRSASISNSPAQSLRYRRANLHYCRLNAREITRLQPNLAETAEGMYLDRVFSVWNECVMDIHTGLGDTPEMRAMERELWETVRRNKARFLRTGKPKIRLKAAVMFLAPGVAKAVITIKRKIRGEL